MTKELDSLFWDVPVSDATHYPLPSGKCACGETHGIPVPPDLWSEDGDRLWLRHDLAATPERAKRIAYLGRNPDRSVVLPMGFGEGSFIAYPSLTVREVTCRPGEDDESGWAGNGTETWWACNAEHPKARRFWEVGVSE